MMTMTASAMARAFWDALDAADRDTLIAYERADMLMGAATTSLVDSRTGKH